MSFWERENASHWTFEIEVLDDRDSSEEEAWFIEEEIGDWSDVYDGGIAVVEVEDDTELSRVMRKPTFAYAKTKTQISFAVTAKLISAFVFAT